jgi:hypothetical protein
MGFPLDLIWLAVPAYIILQFVVIWRSSGPSRWVAALPLVFMVPIFILTVVALIQESNLWPLLLLFASPVALLYVVVVGLFMRAAGKKSSPVS